MLLADDQWQMDKDGCYPQCTPDVDSRDNHGAAGRNVVFTDGHTEWVQGPSIDKYFQEAQADYDAMNVNFETTN